MQDVKDALRRFIAGHLEEAAARKGRVVTVTDDLYILGEQLLDSLEFLNLLMAVEQRFLLEVDFSDRDIAEVTRFGALVDAFAATAGQGG